MVMPDLPDDEVEVDLNQEDLRLIPSEPVVGDNMLIKHWRCVLRTCLPGLWYSVRMRDLSMPIRWRL